MQNYIRKLLGHISVFLLIFIMPSICSATIQGEPIAAEEAFIFQARIINKLDIEFSWQIAPGYHLYQDQLKILNSNNIELLNKDNLPQGIETEDSILGKSVVYDSQLKIKMLLNDKITEKILVEYQGCSNEGFCYEPITKMVHITDKHVASITNSELQEFPNASVVDTLAFDIKNSFLPLTLAIFFGLGFLLSFSPCVLPMIPLVVNLIVGDKKMSPYKSFLLASSYSLGMAGSYAIAGTLVGMMGARFQSWLQQPFILVMFSCILILLALAQLDLINIRIPSFNRKLHHWGQRQLQGSLPGAFILGIISSLIVSPCITPPLIGVLTYIGQNGNPFIGGLTLFCLGLGMGIPLIIVAMLSSVILPKAGRWMNLVKVGTAVALLGLAIWILQRIIEPSLTLVLWAGLCLIFALYLRKGDKLLKGLSLILSIIALVLILLAIQKQCTVCNITKQIAPPAATLDLWKNIQSDTELQKYLSIAKSKHQYTLVEVYATWCASCKRLELSVLTDPQIQEALKSFMLLRIDMSHVSEAENALLNKLNIYGPPTLLLFNTEGVELEAQRMVGNVTTQDLLHVLQDIQD